MLSHLKTWVVHYKSLWRQNLLQSRFLRCPTVHYSWNEPILELISKWHLKYLYHVYLYVYLCRIGHIFVKRLPLENQACTLQTHVFSMCFRDFAQKHPTFSHLYYPSCSESVAFVGDPGRDLELWLPTPFDSWTESTPNERRISSVIGSGSFVGEGSLGIQCSVGIHDSLTRYFSANNLGT